MSCPQKHWTRIASTNPLERVNREVEQRADAIGIFPNDEAIRRVTCCGVPAHAVRGIFANARG